MEQSKLPHSSKRSNSHVVEPLIPPSDLNFDSVDSTTTNSLHGIFSKATNTNEDYQQINNTSCYNIKKDIRDKNGRLKGFIDLQVQ